MQAIILAGGFGTRLKTVVSDVPKPMAPIQSKPFLAYLLDYLHAMEFKQIVLSVHHMSEVIQAYFQNNYRGMTITYAFENEPLGTGGAIVHALKSVRQDEPTWVLNGDTFLALDYKAMYQQHRNSPLTLALQKVQDASRYGNVATHENQIIEFQEKGAVMPGLINAGVYLLHPTLFTAFSLPPIFSFEQDFLQPLITSIKPQAFIVNQYFIDIGIPEDYQRAQTEVPRIIESY
ncbi:MAG: NTP transferase domain-containing protein [Gammaproteobacteria bacterium]|nr:NTP transferase domain-containing protein [Gammaproteobacteria bacterium]